MINVLAYTVPILILGSLLVPDLLIRLDIPLAFPPILCIVCGVPLTLLVVRSVPDGENRAYALCQLIEMSISIVYLVLLFATGRHTYSATTSKSDHFPCTEHPTLMDGIPPNKKPLIVGTFILAMLICNELIFWHLIHSFHPRISLGYLDDLHDVLYIVPLSLISGLKAIVLGLITIVSSLGGIFLQMSRGLQDDGGITRNIVRIGEGMAGMIRGIGNALRHLAANIFQVLGDIINGGFLPPAPLVPAPAQPEDTITPEPNPEAGPPPYYVSSCQCSGRQDNIAHIASM
jgi:hypothetical protein